MVACNVRLELHRALDNSLRRRKLTSACRDCGRISIGVQLIGILAEGCGMLPQSKVLLSGAKRNASQTRVRFGVCRIAPDNPFKFRPRLGDLFESQVRFRQRESC